MKKTKKSLATRITLRTWIALALLLFMLFAIGASALQTPQTGGRNAGVKPKRTPQRRDRNVRAGQSKALAVPMSNSILSPVLATADFDLLGLAVTADPATLTVPKNTATSIHTSVRVPEGSDPLNIIAALNPNYRVRGELTGPSLTAPLTLEAPIGQPLNVPPLSNAGDHLVRNLRVVDLSTPEQAVVTSVTPDSCGIVVIERLLISQVQVHELSYDQIIQAGINITGDSYRAFNFTLGVATSSTPQEIVIPVAFPPIGIDDPRPLVGIPQVSSPGIDVPTVLPVMLFPEGPDGQPSDMPTLPGDEQPKIPGVIIFPGRVGFLHQFFEAIVIVGNGAPNGSPLVLRSLRAKAKLPDQGTVDASDDPLRIAETQVGGRVSELELHGLGPDNKYGTDDDLTSFAPNESGQASFLLEGLKEGLHPISFDLEAMLEGLPSGPIKVRGEVAGAVLVRDASFAVTFTHPSVVRDGNDYDLGMTIYNSGQTDINGAFAKLPPASISGAELDPQDTGQRQFPTTIKKGESATVKWRLNANVTGEVTASYVKVGEGISAGLNLVTGVGDRNIPLSPDSLILPEPVKHLPPNVVDAARALLGQAWSIANAPAGSLPAGIVKVTRQTVVDRAVELGVAGLRVDFGEPVSVSLDTVLRDWLGELQASPDVGFADTQRNTRSGYEWFDSVGAEIFHRLNTDPSPVTPLAFHQEFANTELPRSRFISALVTHASGQAIVGTRFVNAQGKQVGFGVTPNERAGDLAQGSSLRLTQTDVISGAVTYAGQMLAISNPNTDNWTLELNGWQTGTVDLSLVAPTNSLSYNLYSWTGIQITQGAKYRVRFKPLALSSVPVLEEFQDGSWQTGATAAVTPLNQPAPRVVGVIQVTDEVVAGGDKYGRLVGILFSKPMLQDQAQTASRYRIGGGILKGSNPAQQVGDPINVKGATVQFGNRFVFLSLNSTIGPYIERDLTISSLQDTKRLPLSPSPVTTIIGPRVSRQGKPPGAYLTGRVINADGTPVPNAQVIYWIQECPDPALLFPPPPEPIVLKTTDAQGRYAIDYVRDSECSPLSVTVTNPTTNSEKRLSSPVAFDGQHMVLDMVFLARGSVEGTITSAGQPMPKAFVRVVPDLDVIGTKVVQADQNGHYVATDIPVGNVSVLAVGEGIFRNASGFNAGTINGPGQVAFIDVSLQNIAGVVRGRVFRSDQITVAPGSLVVANALIPGFRSTRPDGTTAVGFAFADRDGSFTISNLPVGDIKLEVSDYVTGAVASQNVQLSNAIPEVSGLIIVLPGSGIVTGRVTDDLGTPLANVFVSSSGRGTQTNSLGNYELQSLPAGMRSITAFDAPTQRVGSANAQVNIGQTTSGIDIVILRPSTLEGTVYLVKEGTTTPVPASGVKVSIDGFTIVNTNSQGRYTIANAPPGDYTLRVVDEARGYAVNSQVKLLPGETLTRDATFRPGTIHGKVFQPDGVTPTIAQLSIRVPRPEPARGFGWGMLSTEPPRSTQSAADGSYSLSGVNPGTFRISTSNVFFPTPVSVGGTLPPSGNEEVNLSLVSTLAGKIQGNVFRPDGTTSVGPGIKVTLSGGSLADATVHTDANGHYEFGEVFSAGSYNLTATDPASGMTNRISVSVERNKDAVFDLRLLGLGNVRVQVIDGAGQPVTGGSVTLDGTDYPNVHRFAELAIGSNGQVTFNNLPEGSYAISATRFGLGGRVSANVAINSTVDVSVQLQATGNVEGHVYLPDGTTAISLADVQLRVGGRSIGFTVTSEGPDVGKFTFVNVPTGDFTLDAFDNKTGRVGRAAGSVTTQGETVVVNVLLLPIGAVSGQVTANGIGVDHALVRITADGSGVRGANLLATTDPTGHYRFTGIPSGRFVITVSDAPGGQTGSASGTIMGTVEPLPDTIVNIALEPSQTVRGTVYFNGGTLPVPGAKVTITVAGRVFQTATNDQGVYALAFVPLGAVTVRAEAPVGYDRGEAAPVTGTQPGGTITANVTMNGVGVVSGTALDSNGTLLSSGTVVFTNSVWSPAVVINASVQPNGTYELTGVPTGNFSLRLTVPGRVAVGSASGTAFAAQTTNINLQLEDAGTVTGKVTAADGSTPVQGANVSVTLIRPSGTVSFFTHTGAQGIWTLNNVPLGTLNIKVTDEVSGGIARANDVVLATNGQVVDVGTMVLDSTPISVVSVEPANGALAVPTNGTVVTITFSEPAEASTVNSGTVQLQLNNSSIGVTRSLSSDGRVVTLTPSNRLAESTVYKVFVNQVEDRAGLRIASAFTSTFTTADETAPTVTAINPANNATQVAFNTNVIVTFSEPIDSNDNLANIIKVSVAQSTDPPLAGAYALSTDGRIATFTPAVALADSTQYTVNVNGQRDASGNTQTQAFVSNFTTQDLIAPVIDPLPIDGTTVRDFTPTIIATYHDNLSGIKTSTVVLTVDNVNVTQNASVTGSQVTYTPSTPLTGGPHTVTVQVADNVGNVSALRTASFTIDDSGPDITSFTIGGAPAVDGMFVTSSLQPVFAVTYTDDTGINVSATQLLLAPQGSPLVAVPAVITQTGLTYQPPAFLAEGAYAVQAIITNNQGTSSTTGVINFTLDVDAPEVTSVTPPIGNQHGGTTVTIAGARLLNTNGSAPTITIGGNPTQVTSVVAGDLVTIITPAGAPGPATIRITTDRGTGVLVGGFTYQADPRTPFITEPDTVLLWHMDEQANGAVQILDSGATRSIIGTAASASLSQPGRFAFGRSDANISSSGSNSSLVFGTTNFTVECWVKTGVVPRTYTLVGNEDSNGGFNFFTAYSVRLSPNGNLRAFGQSVNGVTWSADVPSSVYKVDDNQWHYVALVVNRTTSRMSLYIDGIERGFSTAPAGFGTFSASVQQLKVGQRSNDPATPTGPVPFPGIVDEVRVSSTAHTANQIQNTYLGTEGALGITIANISIPVNLLRGTTTDVVLNGYNLASTTASVTGPASAGVTAQVTGSAATQARVRLTVASDALLGDAQLVLSSNVGSASVPIRILDPVSITFAVEADTRLLWHMNETINGTTTIFDESPLKNNGTSGNVSLAQPGRFGGGRSRADIATGGNFTNLYFGSSSFTVEGWVKTDPVGRTYTLFGKEDASGGSSFVPEFGVRLFPNGNLRGYSFDAGSRHWFADLPAIVYRVDDNQWHYIAMVVDRANNRLSLYVDGLERAWSAPPAGFGALPLSGQSFRAGHWAFFDPQTTGGTQDFPGTLDEIRVSATAHSATRILEDMLGSSPLRVISYSPKEVLREKAGFPSTITTIVLNGYNLDGVTASLIRDGQTVDAVVNVVSSSQRQATVEVDALATAPLGIAQLVLSKPGQTDAAVDLRISEQAELYGALDTILLWNLNETGNGAVQVLDSNALGIHGTADADSLEQPGRFGRGRSKANIFSGPDKGALYLGTSSFTAEVWVKTNPVTRGYSLVAKEDAFGGTQFIPEYSLRLVPNGALRAYAWDTGSRQWKAETNPLVVRVDDNLWHHVAMVADRVNQKMFIYVDGVERASTVIPVGFAALAQTSQPVRAGHWAFNEDNVAGGPEEFPGTIDDVRISNTAHSAERIRADLDGVPGLRINSYGPKEIPRNVVSGPIQFTTVTATGFGLDGVTATVVRDGQPLDATVIVDSSSFYQAQLRISVDSSVVPGFAQLVYAKPGLPPVPVDIRIPEQSQLATDVDTRLLWHLNEAGNGVVQVVDSGPLSLGGKSGSVSVAESAGHFGGARSKANIASDPDFDALHLGSLSFTAECWVKTNPVTRGYSLVAKEDQFGGTQFIPEFSLRLVPSGALRAYAWDTGSRQWKAEMTGRVYDPATGRWKPIVDDNEWHHVAMVVDRAAQKMTLYVDGVERASSPMPLGFASLTKTPTPVRVGHWAFNEDNFGGPEEFPGTIDEVRISTTAHSAARIFADAMGTDTAHLSHTQPSYVSTGSVAVPVTFTGYGLANAIVTTDQPAVTLTVTSSTSTQINCLMDVPAIAAIGPLNFTITTTQGQVFTSALTILDQQPFTNAANSGTETLLLWHLDETANGAVAITGSGDPVPAIVGGTAGSLSAAADGRFGKGRVNANIAASTANNSMHLASSSFTIECWMKLGTTITRGYTLVGKEDQFGGTQFIPEYSLRVLPTGGLRAYVHDTGSRQWRAEMLGRVFDPATGRYLTILNDGLWHYIAMVADRATGKLTLYVDGVERASGTIPAGFVSTPNTPTPLRVGHWTFNEAGNSGPEEFPGTIDEVRIQNFPRTAAQIADTWFGTNGGGQSSLRIEAPDENLAVAPRQEMIVNTVTPHLVTRDRASRQPLVTGLALAGANLSGVNARIVRDGQPLNSVDARVKVTTDSQAQLDLAVSPNTPLGPAQLILSKQGYSDVAVEIRVIEPSEFALEADTIGLWHLDERQKGMAHLLDVGPNAINLTSAPASRPVNGRFDTGRTLARATADANNSALVFGNSSFTIESWVKAPALGRDYVLIGKETNNGQNTDFTLKALASGGLRAEIYDTAGLVWNAETLAGAGTLTDDQWHAIALVVDRETGWLSLYIDAQLRMMQPAPVGFGAVRNLGQPLQFGSSDSDSTITNGPDEFPGVLDEIRISSTVHTAEKIAFDFFGNDEPKITFVRPPVVRKSAGPFEVTLSGYGLIGATVAPSQPGVTATVISSTSTSIKVSLTVSDAVPVGPMPLLFKDVLGRGFSAEFTVEERPIGNRIGLSGGPPDIPPNRIKPPRGSSFRSSRLNQHAKPVGGQR
ncbi:MAG TPA: LamG-like jellyroll fold domain-containing protein [Pyrinomonadaceae bacterium]|nr:LamG-like jellyroll fold domain-containing protein [Pyrinomonadaceae bacterium]